MWVMLLIYGGQIETICTGPKANGYEYSCNTPAGELAGEPPWSSTFDGIGQQADNLELLEPGDQVKVFNYLYTPDGLTQLDMFITEN